MHGRYTSDLARELAGEALERFLRYVRIDTQSQEGTGRQPSTAKQLDLSRLLVEELRAAGVADAELDEHGYVYATLEPTVERDVPVVGLVAHVDTAPAVTGAGVRPIVHRAWDGRPLALPGDPRQRLEPHELAGHEGCDLVTTDGTTLLGADDKAGVAAIVTACAHLARHPELPHGRLRVAFTPDEEIGAGVDRFDLERFGADVAYTLDGSALGEIEDETFNAAQVVVTIDGVSTHTGTAKGKLVNAVRLAARYLERLPAELSPEATEGREGFVHPDTVEGSTRSVRIVLIARDHDRAKLDEHVALLQRLGEELGAGEPRAQVRVESRMQYLNMKEVLRDRPEIVEAAEEAMRREGVEPRRTIVRGGTDGSRLTELGLPTPNLFTGGREFHGEKEWLCVQELGAACATLVRLAGVFAERPAAR